MFSNTQPDQQILDCLDWLDQAGSMDIDLPEAAAAELVNIRTILNDAVSDKLSLMSAIAFADISNPSDQRIWSIKKTSRADGSEVTTIRMRYDKVEVLGKLLRLMSYSKPVLKS